MLLSYRLKNKYFHRLLSILGFFEYPKKNKHYKKFINVQKFYFKKTYCPCGSKENEHFSYFDRYNEFFPTLICHNCGLLRAKFSLDNKGEILFYENFYRKIMFQKEKIDYEFLFKDESKKYEKIIKKIKRIINLKNEKVLVIGGGVGGILNYLNESETIFTEYDNGCINFAKKKFKNTKFINGSINEIIEKNIKPKLVILTHVIEHWSSLNEEFIKLKKICIPGETYVYIETPGVDSSKNGRRNYDFSGDIFYGHKFYFSSYVLNNYFKNYGFKNIFSNSKIQSLYLYDSEIKNFYFNKQNYLNVKIDLKKANIQLIFYRLSLSRISKVLFAHIKKVLKYITQLLKSVIK